MLPPNLLILVFVVLGRQDDLVAPALEGFPNDALAILVTVAHSGIHIVQPRLKGSMEHGNRFVAIDSGIFALAHHGQAHRAEPQLRHPIPRATQFPIDQVQPPHKRRRSLHTIPEYQWTTTIKYTASSDQHQVASGPCLPIQCSNPAHTPPARRRPGTSRSRHSRHRCIPRRAV